MIRNSKDLALKNIISVTFTGLYETNSNQIKNTTKVKKKIEGFMMFTERSSSKIILCQFFYN
jgi:hypothetical protein